MSVDIDDFMRAALVIQFLFIAIVRSTFAGGQIGEKKGRQWKESFTVWIGLGVCGIALFYTLVVYLLSFDQPWMYMGLPEVVRWLGFAASLAALGFLFWVFKTIGTAGAKYLITFDDMKLVTNGPYSRVRHPMYAGGFLWGITVLLFTDHWGIGGTFVGLAVLMVVLRLPNEEKVLTERFGDEYRQYMARTARLLPFGSRKGPDSSAE